MKDKLMNGLLMLAAKLQSQRHFSAIRVGLTTLLPITIIGSFCTLFSKMNCLQTRTDLIASIKQDLLQWRKKNILKF